MAGNSAANGLPDIADTGVKSVVTADHCLIGVADTGFILWPGSAANFVGTAVAPRNPLLGPLADNGGPTPTCLPLAGSLAFDRGTNPTNLATDQRGNSRLNGLAPDIGAVEGVSPGLPIAVASAPTVTSSGGTSYQFTVTCEDATAVAVNSFGGSNITVTGPNGFSAAATLVGVDVSSNGTPRTATYSTTPPGGAWASSADGQYVINVQPNQILDTAGNAVTAGPAGTFSVMVPKTITVTTLADSGHGSLRDAIGQANGLRPAADTIVFDPSLFAAGSGTITLLSALPTIAGSLTITGPELVNGQPQLTVQRSSTAATQFSVFTIDGPGGAGRDHEQPGRQRRKILGQRGRDR